MVSTSKDDDPSKVTPTMNKVTNTHPKTVKQVDAYLSPVGREKSNQPMACTGIHSDEVPSWIPLMISCCFHLFFFA